MEPTQAAEVTLELVEVTPEMALDLLAGNTNNRHVRNTVVESYARDMTEGKWRAGSGEPIHIAPDGTIGNGQHRLLAVLESEVTVTLPMLHAPLEWRMVADQGSKRTFADILRITYREANHAKLAAAVRLMWEYRRAGTLGFGANSQLLIDGERHILGSPTVTELERTYLAEQGLREHVHAYYYLRSASGADIMASVATTLSYLTHSVDEDDAQFFWDRAALGDQLSADSPILALRRVMTGDSRPTRARVQAALVIKAWNGYRAGDPVRNLSWRAGGASPEPFPVISGLEDKPKRKRR
jgi:hypothetical protein